MDIARKRNLYIYIDYIYIYIYRYGTQDQFLSGV